MTIYQFLHLSRIIEIIMIGNGPLILNPINSNVGAKFIRFGKSLSKQLGTFG